jgi:hypothetical protein
MTQLELFYKLLSIKIHNISPIVKDIIKEGTIVAGWVSDASSGSVSCVDDELRLKLFLDHISKKIKPDPRCETLFRESAIKVGWISTDPFNLIPTILYDLVPISIPKIEPPDLDSSPLLPDPEIHGS